MWQCEHVHIRGEVYLLNHPENIAHCVCGVKLWTSSHWRVCLWASLCPLSFTELKPLRTDSLARGFCLVETSALITEDCFLFMTFLCLPHMTITFQDTCILSHLHIISAILSLKQYVPFLKPFFEYESMDSCDKERFYRALCTPVEKLSRPSLFP